MSGNPLFWPPSPEKNPYLIVPQSMIDRYGVDELKRRIFEVYHRDIEIVASKPMPMA